jgi:acylphosphatase
MAEQNVIALHVRVTGQVQGVYFRVSVQKVATTLGVNGYVKNELDGAVYAEIEGDSEMVFKLIHYCHRGPQGAVVEQVSVTEGTVAGHTRFEIR